ncbi:gliding motility-associated C-terminal domain-containing protein [Hufsiella ginkgonis]|uniref:T9SS type B sorting domain-containing protein n=1 Tax=Hufsiella ginkgonis TaxID=2695274 RepID=A0A7K1XZ51_9SPHI|nr:gliding motility-associated C-terminal domain-containing protein [Hufsiella ginkgonis]MXV16222.1 T9SS type B sorting domain-containing protein [Hufsiella ginkgonis]
MKKYLFLLLCVPGIFKVSAQSFYASSASDYYFPGGDTRVYRITKTPAGFSTELLTACAGPAYKLLSIAMDATGLYWVNGYQVGKAEISGNSLVNCRQIATVPGGSAALTIGTDNKLYYSAAILTTTDVSTGQTRNLGPMTYQPTGDMTFYEGELYMTAREGVIKIDINDPANSTLHIPLPASLNMYGMVTLATSLHKNTVYGLCAVSATQTDIIELDIDNRINKGVVGSLPINVLDAASIVEDGSIVGIQLDKVKIRQGCDAASGSIAEISLKPHLEPVTFTLDNGTTNTTGIFTGLEPGTYSVTMKSASDEQTAAFSVQGYIADQPTVSYTTHDPACAAKGDVRFSVAGTSSGYQVMFGSDVFPAAHLFEGLGAGKYHFVILNAAGCIVKEADIVLKYKPCDVVISDISTSAECDIIGRDVLRVNCPPIPETYLYTLTGQATNTTNSTGVFGMLSPGTYQLTVNTSGGGTPQSRTISMPDFSLTKPVTRVSITNPLCELPGKISLAVETGAALYDIRFNGRIYPSDHVFSDLEAGDYQFEVLRKNGCIADKIDVALVAERCSPVSFPSAFTPNGDGVNDLFRAKPESTASNFRLRIFDKWGALVFSTTDLHGNWDGNNARGRPMPVSTYYWIATFISLENKQVIQKGAVTLVR